MFLPSGRNRGRIDCHPERRAQPVAEGSARALQADFSAPSGRFSCPPLVPVGSETASTAHAFTAFSGAEGLNAVPSRMIYRTLPITKARRPGES